MSRLFGFFRQLTSVLAPGGTEADSDGALLSRYAGGDRDAFDALVRRHGPMVLGVCRRVLGNPEDAEDAFQATFILLARKARSVRWQESARGWLYEVAYRTACKARTRLVRRKNTERLAAETRLDPPEASPEVRELVLVIDEELARMPATYRMPLVLCCLQDQTVDEAAKQLGCSPAAVKSRLQRARERLRERLARRGFALSVALLMATLGQGHVLAVPPPMATSAVRAATVGPAPEPARALADDLQNEWRWTNSVRAAGAALALGLALVIGRVAVSDFRRAVEPTPDVHVGGADDRLFTGASSSGDEPAIEIDPKPVLGVSFNARQRFGFVILNERDPENPDRFKKLTFMEDGSYNNTCVRVDGAEHLYGQAPGDWVKDEKTRRKLSGVMVVKDRKWVSAWEYPGKVRVTQTVVIVPNDETRPAKLNTALIHYTVENRDRDAHKVGLRIMLDTYIGAEDGVPFAIPGQAELVTTKRDIRELANIPDFIQALERANLEDPGTTATMMLRFPPGFRLNPEDPPLDPIVRLLLCRYPGNPDASWDFSREAFWDMNDKTRGERNDSCVTLYWPERVMAAGEKRVMAFSYGLGKISGDGEPRQSKLALTYNPKPTPGSEFTVTAWIKNPREGQEVTVNLPPGMTLVEPPTPSQGVVRGRTELAQVSWRVRVASDAKLEICQVTVSTNGSRASIGVPVRTRPTGIFFSGI